MAQHRWPWLRLSFDSKDTRASTALKRPQTEYGRQASPLAQRDGRSSAVAGGPRVQNHTALFTILRLVALKDHWAGRAPSRTGLDSGQTRKSDKASWKLDVLCITRAESQRIAENRHSYNVKGWYCQRNRTTYVYKGRWKRRTEEWNGYSASPRQPHAQASARYSLGSTDRNCLKRRDKGVPPR